MANVKISNLTAATTPVAGTEVLPIVQSGATVKVSIANLTPGLDTITAAKGGTGQTSYAVGDLLYASTTTALSKLADVATGNALISGGVSTAPSWGKIGLTTHVSGVLPTANGGTNLSSFTANGVVYASSTSALTTGSALVFDGTNLGVGVTPSAIAANYATLQLGGSVGGGIKLGTSSASVGYVVGSAGGVEIGTTGSTSLSFFTNNATRATLDTSGNLGLGVTPSAWGSSLKAIQLPNAISLASFSGGATPNAYLSTNIYFNGSNWIFNGTYGASRYEQVSGQHQWFGISSGTAGGTATLPQLMTLDASGNLRLGTTSDLSAGDKFTVVGGNIAVQRTSGITTFLGDSTQNGYVGTITNHAFAFLTNSTERARIDSSGNLLVGTTSAAAKLTVVANNASANGSAYIQNDTGTSGSGVLYTNFSNASATTSSYYFLVARNGGGSTYVLRADGTMTFSSDARLKKNIVSSDGYLSRLNQLRPVSYQWNYQKEGDETTSLGLIAQEVEQVFPNLVIEESFVEGEEARKSVKYSELPMMLLKAIQEQQALITQLQADVASLKGA